MRRRCSALVLVAGLAGACGSKGGGASDSSSGSSSGGSGSSGGADASTSVGSHSGSSSGSADVTGSSSGSDTMVDTTSGEFVLDVHTQLTDDGRLALRCNLPPDVASCAAVPGAPCDDADADGLADVWEDAVLDRLRPLRRLDEGEPLLTDGAAVLADVGRVVAVGERYRLFVMLGYSADYGSCSFTAHDGDSERVALDLEPWPDGGVGGVATVGAYTAAHEGTANDHGRVFTGADLGMLVFALDDASEPRWVVYPSASKHATYASIEICEGISAIPCIDEDCAPDGVDDPAAYDLLPEFANAGEEAMPRVDDLGVVGFPGDSAWAMQDFCGGQGPGNCSAPVRDKLLVDPFE
ncbi:MAG: hypothetical protein K1X88_24230 [Nannocystaceae bacterium]|nr:hypothetical protein [Nannocystaceae bacterium]